MRSACQRKPQRLAFRCVCFARATTSREHRWLTVRCQKFLVTTQSHIIQRSLVETLPYGKNTLGLKKRLDSNEDCEKSTRNCLGRDAEYTRFACGPVQWNCRCRLLLHMRWSHDPSTSVLESPGEATRWQPRKKYQNLNANVIILVLLLNLHALMKKAERNARRQPKPADDHHLGLVSVVNL